MHRVGTPEFDLDTKAIGGLPVVNRFFERLNLREFLEKHLGPPDPRSKLAPARVIEVLIRNVVLSRAPLYELKDWCTSWVPELLGLDPEQVPLLNDDRVGRALELLFCCDRSALLTDLVVHAVREFEVDLDQFHNDSTSLTLHGNYENATGQPVKGRPTLHITYGHNKDYRPDLKQLLWILTTSADGCIPVHFKVTHGNTEDSTTHQGTWDLLRRLVGSVNFLYVADCKLCTRANLRHIADNHGRFITVLPRSRKEDRLFKDWLQDHAPAWEDVVCRPHPRRKDGPLDIVVGCVSPIAESDGYRLLWYRSSHKLERDAQARGNTIETARKGLQELKDKLEGPRSRLRTVESVVEKVEEILRDGNAKRWLDYQVHAYEDASFRQEKSGRPGRNTRYRRIVKTRFRLSWSLCQDKIDYDVRCDGIFPLLTNCKDLTLLEVFDAYRNKQPLIEKRHHLFKNVLGATPLLLKNITRIEALLFVFFVALLVNALIERELRRRMASRGLSELPLYPEGRRCKAPTTERVMETFAPLQRHLLVKHGSVVQRFDPDLNKLQQKLCSLLGVQQSRFRSL